MTIAHILALMEGTGTGASALKAAVTLGRRFSARVDLLHVAPDPATVVPVVGEGMSGAAVQQIVDSIRAEAEGRSKTARGVFESCRDAESLPVVGADDAIAPGTFQVSYREVVGEEDTVVLQYGRLSDLIVMARPKEEGEAESSAAFDAALFDSGRPVLLTPAKPVSGIGKTVAVAWNRSREATRAVAAAMPLLREAEKVVVLTARESETGPAPSELAGYLAGHGIAAKTWAFLPVSRSIGDDLLSEAADAGADLLVMGAYGHSRLRELVLGGATREVLSRGAIPVLLVH